MTAVRDNDELHRLVDRLTPGQAQRLLALAKADPALAAAAGAEEPPPLRARHTDPVAEPGPDGDAIRRFRSFVGVIDSGRGDLSEDHEEIIRDGLTGQRDHHR